MPRDELINLLGLYSDPNQYLAPGAGCRLSQNVWLVRQGLLQKRRGYKRWSNTLTFAVNKLFPYEGGFIAHSGSGVLQRVTNAGAVSSYGSGFSPPTTTWRTRAAIAGKNFYFNTNAETYRLSGSSGVPTKAGGLVAPGFDSQAPTTVLTDSGAGFLADGSAVAYRYCLVSLDAFGREIEGPVSGRIIRANVTGVGGYSGGNTGNVTVRALLPPDATDSHFIRIFRSAQKPSGQALDDDMKLVYEVQLKQLDVTNGYFQQKDITPDALRGAFIYTAPNAGEGLGQNNEQPPRCADLTFFKRRLWFANTTRRSEFDLQLLAVGGTEGVQNGDKLIIGGLTFTAKSATPGANEYLLEVGGTTSFNIEQTAMNLVSCINKSASNTILWARYVSAPDDVPGRIFLFSRSVTASAYTIAVGAGSKRDCWNPSLLPTEHVVDLARVAGVVTATMVTGNQSFKVGERILMNPNTGPVGSFGIGPFTLTAITANTFVYTEAGVPATTTGSSAFIYSDDIGQFFQESKVNRCYYSKIDEFDAVPLDNWIDVGAEDSEIIAVVAGRAGSNLLQFWKRDGVFRLLGDDELSFAAVPCDGPTVKAVAREMICHFRGEICGLTDMGFVRVNETGRMQAFDNQIHNDVLSAIESQGDNLETLGFMVPYESEGLLLAFVGGNRDIASGLSTLCNEGFVFSTRADEWSSFLWDVTNGDGNGKRCGIFNPVDRLLYFGDSYLTSGSQTFVYQERKARASTDYRDQRGDGLLYSIKSVVAPVIQTGRAPGMDKHWQEVALLFNGNQPASLTVDDANELGAGGTHTLAALSGYVHRFWPFPQASRGSVLLLTITHDTIGEGFDLAGLQVTYEVTGSKVSR